MRILSLVLVLVFGLMACSDDSTSKDAAIADATMDAAVEMSVQLDASVETAMDVLVVTDTDSSDTVTPSDAVAE